MFHTTAVRRRRYHMCVSLRKGFPWRDRSPLRPCRLPCWLAHLLLDDTGPSGVVTMQSLGLQGVKWGRDPPPLCAARATGGIHARQWRVILALARVSKSFLHVCILASLFRGGERPTIHLASVWVHIHRPVCVWQDKSRTFWIASPTLELCTSLFRRRDGVVFFVPSAGEPPQTDCILHHTYRELTTATAAMLMHPEREGPPARSSHSG
jgi:hypothetical protein